MADNNDIFGRILDATTGAVRVSRAVRGESTENQLLEERVRFNRLNGSGSADDSQFLRGGTADLNVDGATPIFAQAINFVTRNVSVIILLVVAILVFGMLMRKRA